MARRQNLALSVALAFALIFSFTYLFSTSSPALSNGVPAAGISRPGSAGSPPPPQDARDAAEKPFAVDLNAVPGAILDGDSIAPKLENATLK